MREGGREREMGGGEREKTRRRKMGGLKNQQRKVYDSRQNIQSDQSDLIQE